MARHELDEAVAEISGFVDPDRVGAASRLAELMDRFRPLNPPERSSRGNRVVVFRASAEDRNWSSLVEILKDEDGRTPALKDLDESSDKVVAQLPNPHGDGEYHCRGLVLGYVQSGKTTNFTAVIAKAAEPAIDSSSFCLGSTTHCAQQTQDRLNAQLWEPHPELWNRLTNEATSEPRPTSTLCWRPRTSESSQS